MSAASVIKYNDDEINIRPARKEDMATVAKMIQVANFHIYYTEAITVPFHISITLVFPIDARIVS